MNYEDVLMSEMAQVLPQRTVEDEKLTSGVINLEWSTERNEAVGENTFLDIQFEMYNNTGSTKQPLVSADNVALNMNAPAILFDQISLKINGTTVIEINDYSVVDFLRMRQKITGYRLDNLYNNLMITSADPDTRKNATIKVPTAGSNEGNTTFDFIKNVLPLELLFEGLSGSPIKGKANYCLSLQPNVRYKDQIISQKVGLLPDNIVRNVKGIVLYVEKLTLKYESNFKQLFKVNNIKLFREPILADSGQEQKTFYLSPKTRGVTISFQSLTAGQSTTSSSVTAFNTLVYDIDTQSQFQDNLTFLQLNYLGKNYTPAAYNLLKNSNVIGTGVLSGNKNNNAYAYFSSIRQLNNNEPESEDSYNRRGQYYYFNVYNPEGIKNNNLLTLRYAFSSNGKQMNVLVFEHTENICELTVANHEIRSITMN